MKTIKFEIEIKAFPHQEQSIEALEHFINTTKEKTGVFVDMTLSDKNKSFCQDTKIIDQSGIISNCPYINTYTLSGYYNPTNHKDVEKWKEAVLTIANEYRKSYDYFFGKKDTVIDVTFIDEKGLDLQIINDDKSFENCINNIKTNINKEENKGKEKLSFTMRDRHKHTIPCGAVYIRDGKKYTTGEPFPEDVKTGDIYRYDGYEYCYNHSLFPIFNKDRSGSLLYEDNWRRNEEQEGWGVKIKDKKHHRNREFNAMLPKINDKPITNADYTYHDCQLLLKAPPIPETVTSMNGTFNGCNCLIMAPALPPKLKKGLALFMGCTLLREYANSPEGTTFGDFSNYHIPETFEEGKWIFKECKSMIVPPTFEHCTKMKDIYDAFELCVSLNDLSKFAFPSQIEPSPSNFYGCYSLSEKQIDKALTIKLPTLTLGDDFFSKEEDLTTSNVSENDTKKHDDINR
jgi:hypothetical protein